MRWRALAPICVLAAPLLMIGCGGDDDKPTEPLPPSGGEIEIPFGPNDHWTYLWSDVDENARPENARPETGGHRHAFAALNPIEALRDGNRATDGARASVEVRRSLAGTRDIDGLTYHAVIDSIEDEADTTYMRQAGADLWLTFEFETSGNPIEVMIIDALNRTLPWKLATFGVASGTSWTMADIDTLVIVEGIAVDVDISVRGENRGLEAVSGPAGDWSDAQKIRVTQDVSVSVEGFFRVTQLSRQDDWYVDGVGLVREDVSGSYENPGGSGTFATTMELTAYDVE